VIAGSFYYCSSTGVADTETFTGNSVDKCLAAGSTVKCNVSYYNVVLCLKLNTLRRIYDQLAAG